MSGTIVIKRFSLNKKLPGGSLRSARIFKGNFYMEEKMLKRIPVLFVTLLLSMTFAFSSAHALPMVCLELVGTDVTVGDSFDVQVLVTDSFTGVNNLFGLPEELLAFGFDVSTTGTVLSYSGYTVDPLFWDTSDPLNPNNVAGSAFPGVDVTANQDVLLATLTFDALSAGTGTISTTGLYDGLFLGLFYEVSGFDIDAALAITVKPIPEPTTMLLFGFGLTCLGVVSRYRKK